MKTREMTGLLLGLLLAGCANPSSESGAFTITNVTDATAQRGTETVRVTLRSEGELAEADAGAILNLMQVVATHQATRRQREIAEARARALTRERTVSSRPIEKKSRDNVVGATQSERTGRDVAADTPRIEKKTRETAGNTSRTEKKSRYIAVETAKSEGVKSDRSVMLWDTQAQEMVGNKVYDIVSPPEPGAMVRFDTYSAEYVGSGT